MIKVVALTRSAAQICQEPKLLQEKVVQWLRIERINWALGKEFLIHNLQIYFTGDSTTFSAAEIKTTVLTATDYGVNEDMLLLLFCPRSTPMDGRAGMMRLVMSALLQNIYYTYSILV